MTQEELYEQFLADAGGDYSTERFDSWFRHHLWRECPVEDCEWCAREVGNEKE